MPGNLSTCIEEPTDFLLVSYVIFRPEPSESSPVIVGVGVTSQPSTAEPALPPRGSRCYFRLGILLTLRGTVVASLSGVLVFVLLKPGLNSLFHFV